MFRVFPLVFILFHHSVYGAEDNSGIIRNESEIKALLGDSGLSVLLRSSGDTSQDEERRWNSNQVLSNQDSSTERKRVIKLCEDDQTFLANTPEWTVPLFARIGNPGELELFNFSIKFGYPFCGNATLTHSIRNGAPAEANAETPKFRESGYLQIGDHFYDTDEYCLSTRLSDEEIQVKVCEPECSVGRPCLRKCLVPGKVLSYTTRKPTKTKIEYKPQFYKDLPEKLTPVDSDSIHPHYIQHKPKQEVYKCQGAVLMNPFSEDAARVISTAENKVVKSIKFRVRTDGRLFFEDLDDYNCLVYREFPNDNMCIDGIQDVGQPKPFSNEEDEGLMFSCNLPRIINVVFSLAFGIIMLISSTFLLLILIVYGLLWKTQNIHGWTVMGHTTSMFFGYIFLGLTHIFGAKVGGIIGSTYCYIHGVLTHFFFLSTFCWLTLISFDLWWTFRSVTPSKKKVDNRIYVHVCIGWGIPALIVITSVCLDLAIGKNCTSIRLPNYGEKSCFVTPNSLGFYIYFPVAITLALDVIFFCVTLYWLYHYKRNTQSVAKNGQDNRRQLVTLFSKLFFVMGITWVFEFISWVHSGVHLVWFWAVVDTINVLQAFAIFVIYVCKRDILDNLEKTYPFLSKHLIKYIRGGCCKRSQPSEDDKEKTKATLMACSNH